MCDSKGLPVKASLAIILAVNSNSQLNKLLIINYQLLMRRCLSFSWYLE